MSKPSLPWRAVNDFLADIGTARSTTELGALALERIGRLVPHDWGAGVFQYRSGKVPPCVRITPGGEEFRRHFNGYWLRRFPLPLDYVAANRIIDFGLWEDSEYYQDFLRPARIRWAAGSWGSYQVSTYRTASSPRYTEREAAILEVLGPHLRNLYAHLATIERLSRPGLTAAEIRPGGAPLTRREVEVVRCLARRMSAREIGSVLVASPRTIERHIANIYEKLGVHSRVDLLRHMDGD